MPYLADADALVADGIITLAQAQEIALRSRSALVALAINALLCAGVLAATLGLVAYLGEPVPVAVFGLMALITGLSILTAGSPLYRIFGNATALIGAGMLLAGGGVELMDNYPSRASTIMLAGGAVVALLALLGHLRGPKPARAAFGAIMLMGIALHLTGLFFGLADRGVSGWPMPVVQSYAFVLILGAGIVLDLRLISALAIVPFAQILSTQTLYSDFYAVFSPEPTLTILQMGLLCALCLWAQGRLPGRVAPQLGSLGALGFVLANVNFLVGSVMGDVVGDVIWANALTPDQGTLAISAGLYAVVWAVLLVGTAIWAATGNRRRLFNATMVFAIIHAFVQLFQSFGDQPLAYVVGGLAAVPLAWGLWRANDWIKDRETGLGVG